MKYLDKLLQKWRLKKAMNSINQFGIRFPKILDVGTSEGELFTSLSGNYKNSFGLDPNPGKNNIEGVTLIKGLFPDGIPNGQKNFDVISFIAVIEHLPEKTIRNLGTICFNLLSDNGIIVITVPHPIVDKILDVLCFFKLIDGMDVGSHHGFGVKNIHSLFCKESQISLLKHQQFQMGLNNLFVLKKEE